MYSTLHCTSRSMIMGSPGFPIFKGRPADRPFTADSSKPGDVSFGGFSGCILAV